MKSLIRLWVILYALGLTVLPPIHWHGKTFFWAEILLAPLYALWVVNLIRHRERPHWPKALKLTLGACFVALLAGLLRGEDGARMSIYPISGSDAFSAKDVIVFLRWAIIFATPVLVKEAVTDHRLHNPSDQPLAPFGRELLRDYLKTLGFGIFISSLGALAERAGTLFFVSAGYHENVAIWQGRTYGTFITPLEAGLVFAATTLFCLFVSIRRKRVELWPVLLGSVSFLALLTTHTATAVVSFILTLGVVALVNSAKRIRWMIMTALIGVLILLVALLPWPFVQWKFNDLIIRAETWKHWAAFLPRKPWYALVGIGWSQLNSDNSYLVLLMKGGLLLLAASLFWIKSLWKYLRPSLKPVFVFWLISWLTVDSIGYWGLGRMLWVLWGLLVLAPDKPDGLSQKNS